MADHAVMGACLEYLSAQSHDAYVLIRRGRPRSGSPPVWKVNWKRKGDYVSLMATGDTLEDALGRAVMKMQMQPKAVTTK